MSNASRYTVLVSTNVAIGTFTAALRAPGRKDRTCSDANREKAIAGVLCLLHADDRAAVKVTDEASGIVRGAAIWTPEEIRMRAAGFAVAPKCVA